MAMDERNDDATTGQTGRTAHCQWHNKWFEFNDYRCHEVVGETEQLYILHLPAAEKNLDTFCFKVAAKLGAADFNFSGTVFPEQIVSEPSRVDFDKFEGPRLGIKSANFAEGTVCANVSFRRN